VLIKLLLLEIDEKKEMNERICIKDPQNLIVTNLSSLISNHAYVHDSIIIPDE